MIVKFVKLKTLERVNLLIHLKIYSHTVIYISKDRTFLHLPNILKVRRYR